MRIVLSDAAHSELSNLEYLPACLACFCLFVCLLFCLSVCLSTVAVGSLQRIDLERANREVMDPNLRGKPRLISEAELPSWLLRDEEEVSRHSACDMHVAVM